MTDSQQLPRRGAAALSHSAFQRAGSFAALQQERSKDCMETPEPMPGPLHRILAKLRPSTKSSVSISPEMIILCAVVYGVLVFAMGKAFLPGGPAFATLVIWICSVTAAEIAHWLRIPRVVGMLGAGLILANVPGNVVAAFPAKWGVQMRAAALATIFLRCGLELEFKTMALYKWPALRLAFLPGLCEAVFDAGLAKAVFGMPFTLALSLGFILKAVGPGLVVPAMFQMQKAGWGAAKGIPSTVVIAASFDDIIAITGFSIFINVAVATGEGAAWQIASGPLQVVFGMLGGMIAGAALGATKLFNNRYKRLLGIYGAALLIMFFLEHYDMLSGGALGSLTVGMVTCLMWEHGRPHRLSQGPSQNFSADVERVMAVVWNWVMEPMLFATIGTSIVFQTLSSSTLPKSLLVVCAGLCLRIIVTYLIMGRVRYTWKEQLFFAVAWTPKATVQASLSAVPLSLIERVMVGAPDYDAWVQWGQDILATGIFAIIVCASLGTAAVHWLAPLLLEQELPEHEGKTRTASLATRSFMRQRSLGRDTHTATPVYSGEVTADVLTEVLQEMRGADDHSVINQYFDSIEKLVAMVMEGRGAQAKDEGLCESVLYLQDAIARDVGPREMTVRQMLHSAALRSRQPSITAAAADHLVRLSASAFTESTVAASLKGASPPGSLSGTSPRALRISSPHAAGSAGGGGGSSGGGDGGGAGGGGANGSTDMERGERGWPLESIGSNAVGSHRASAGSTVAEGQPGGSSSSREQQQQQPRRAHGKDAP